MAVRRGWSWKCPSFIGRASRRAGCALAGRRRSVTPRVDSRIEEASLIDGHMPYIQLGKTVRDYRSGVFLHHDRRQPGNCIDITIRDAITSATPSTGSPSFVPVPGDSRRPMLPDTAKSHSPWRSAVQAKRIVTNDDEHAVSTVMVGPSTPSK